MCMCVRASSSATELSSSLSSEAFEDYTPIEEPIVFQPDESFKEIFVMVINDTIVEPEEDIILEFNSTMPRVDGQVLTLFIQDDDCMSF